MLLPQHSQAAQSIKIRSPDFHTHQLEVEKKLVLVVYQVLKVSKQESHRRFALRDEHRRHALGQIRIRHQREAFSDSFTVFTNALARFFNFAVMIHFHFSQAGKMSEAIRIELLQHGAETRQALKQMTEQFSERKRNFFGPPSELVTRRERDQMLDSICLLFDLFEKKG